MSTLTTFELAGVRLAEPVHQAALLGRMYARAWLELVAQDHSYTFRSPMQVGYVPGAIPGPGAQGILWMAGK